MYTSETVSLPGDILIRLGVTLKLIEAISCLSNASDLLLEGFDPSDRYVRHWLKGASDDLMDVPLEPEPGSVRRELLLMLAGIEMRSQSAFKSITPASIDALHGRLAKVLRAHRSSPLSTRAMHTSA